MTKKNRRIYRLEVKLKRLQIKNASRAEFRTELELLPRSGHFEVEQLDDDRKIVIEKPGRKSVHGDPTRSFDFMVYVLNPNDNTGWRITHEEIWEDIENKGKFDKVATLRLIGLLKEVHAGKEPDDSLAALSGPLFAANAPGEPVDLLLKVYKWIWGQEDVNYPHGAGRDMSIRKIENIEQNLKSNP